MTAARHASRQQRLAAFCTPPLLLVGLLYHAFANLQINVMDPASRGVLLVVLTVSIVLGLLAAFGGAVLRALVIAVVAVAWVDVTTDLPDVFFGLAPEIRHLRTRDRTRVGDIQRIQEALEAHIAKVGPLPHPEQYGEGSGPPTFWQGWWDVSTHDGDGDGLPFLDFLVDRGLMERVPVDPENVAPADGDPTGGRQYAFLYVPAGYGYEGGLCAEQQGKAAYVLGVTGLEARDGRDPRPERSANCDCVWRDKPDFFSTYFDYVVCGYFAP